MWYGGNPLTTRIDWKPTSIGKSIFVPPLPVRHWWYSGNPLTTRIDWKPTVVVAAPRLSITIFQDGTRDGETQHSELVQAAEMLWRVAQAVMTSNKLSGTVTDRNGVVTATWTYNPTAPS
jgi:hypothetical protein